MQESQICTRTRYPAEVQEDIDETLQNMHSAKWYTPPKVGNFSLFFKSKAFLNPEVHGIVDWELPEDYQEIYPLQVLENLWPLLTLCVIPIPKFPPATDWSQVEEFIRDWRLLYK